MQAARTAALLGSRARERFRLALQLRLERVRGRAVQQRLGASIDRGRPRCHDHARPTARPGALRIFDLREQDWSARVTDLQMDHMVARFDGFQMPPADQVAVRKFLDAERARRSASTPPPGDDAPTP